MSKPVQEQILDVIDARLKLITKANGYFNDVNPNNVYRASLTPFKGDDLPAINYWATGTNNIERGAGFEKKEFLIEVEMHSKTYDRPFIDVANEMSADITIAVYRDIANPKVSDNPSYMLGDMVDSLVIQSVVPEIGQGQKPFCGVLVSLSLTYRIKPHNPFTIIN